MLGRWSTRFYSDHLNLGIESCESFAGGFFFELASGDPVRWKLANKVAILGSILGLCLFGVVEGHAQDASSGVPPVTSSPPPSATLPAAPAGPNTTQQSTSPAAAAPSPSQVPAETSITAVLPPVIINNPTPRSRSGGKKTSKKTTKKTSPSQPVQSAPAQGSGEGVANATPLEKATTALDQARESLMPKIGASSYTINRQAIETLPQGEDTPVDKVLLQAPGVSYDSAVSNPDYHVRNEYAFVQYRINGILLPEGVSGLGPVLDTNFVGSLSLLTGALPAEYGLRTAGVVDITSRTFFAPEGSVSLYGGSRGTLTPSFDYGGSSGGTQYFFTGRFFQSDLGLENPTSSWNAIHDQTDQGKFFGYVSTLLNDSTRLSYMVGGAISQFQIPNNPGQVPLGDFGVPPISSTSLNENEDDEYFYNIVTLQTKSENTDAQLSFYSRYADVHFIPDIPGDLFFNGVASNVTRESILNGVQGDGSYTLNDQHKLRAGFSVTAEDTNVANISTLLAVAANGDTVQPPFTVADRNSTLGLNLGAYVQDEWKISDKLTLNTGIRFDQLYQFVDANQFSPRVGLVYSLFPHTKIHAGYARYFTPPYQAQATPTNLALFQGTTAQPIIPIENPVLPERSHYFDVGVDQTVFPGFDVGFDGYRKIATDLLDDGQFGQAVVLTNFNYAKGYSDGVEFKAKYYNGGFKAYANLAWNTTEAKDIVSNQYLFDDPVEFAFIQNHYHFTDDTQLVTASAGMSYHWAKTTFSTDMIFGSGLRSGFANMDHVPPYTQVNLGISHEFNLSPNTKPFTLRFDVVNLFDKAYELRDGTGIGVFAPQFGPRLGLFTRLSVKL
jgi:outer membrane receptor protein involved in Fe transport